MLAAGAALMGGALIEPPCTTAANMAARSDMLLGSMLAGQAFANSPVAAVHALAYPIGGHFHIPHGLSNALVLPHVLRFNASRPPGLCRDRAVRFSRTCRYRRAGRAAGLLPSASPRSPAAAACRTPPRHVHPGRVPATMATDAMNQTRLLVNNPRPVTEADALEIYRAAY